MHTSFIGALKKVPGTEDFDNLYRGNSRFARLRRKNLGLYLDRMRELSPQIMLVGEAPGYKGCKLTGVPFTCESLLFQNKEHSLLGKDHGYQRISGQGPLERETSAIVVWEELNKYPLVPLIWNIFPFHPHVQGEKRSNRTPRVAEIRLGLKFIKQLIEMFPVTRIAAIGRKAQKGLSEMKIEPEVRYIRHPSYGGKKDFVEGLAAFMKS